MCQLAKRNAENKTQPGRLRIVAGNWRSRLLEIADVPGLRPTSARIRETVFNWLAPRIAGARCLDLFAGTGALGLEALSRGAAGHFITELNEKGLQADESGIVLSIKNPDPNIKREKIPEVKVDSGNHFIISTSDKKSKALLERFKVNSMFAITDVVHFSNEINLEINNSTGLHNFLINPNVCCVPEAVLNLRILNVGLRES